FELSHANKLYDQNREFILEHNFYWPDFNLYLSKIRQGWQGELTARELYTSEPHRGSLIQEFYLVLGLMGKNVGLDPNFSYQLGRLILSPLLLLIVILLVSYLFRGALWQILTFIIVFVSGSFPRIYTDSQGALQVGRFMEWWSNIDAVQRITFVPHILFGQVVSFFILYQFIVNKFNISGKKIALLIFLGNAAGLVFPPSLITLNSVLLLILFIPLVKTLILPTGDKTRKLQIVSNIIFIVLTLPSLLYIFIITKIPPWTALIDFHRTHPMMIPFWEYILGTGPIFFLGILGAMTVVLNRDRKFQPFILWVLVTFLFAILFTHLKEQSPLRFTQTGLFIPLGILGTYFLQKTSKVLGKITSIIVALYILENLYMMKVSLDWQTTFITQRVGANIPAVPYPPQTLYPLKNWMEGIRFLRDNATKEDVILAEITAGNFIPAYAGKTVYFGQSNTIDFEEKQLNVQKFYRGELTPESVQSFLHESKVTYIFFSTQEKDLSQGRDLVTFYPTLKKVYSNDNVIIYR
ncbi:hypothetical protein HY407_05030, partial [Candidatus Gottesmanbacteria bacterium]|nr:hypothetical protein [Candidatus Gottesmanbacteria bacterium]